MSSRPLTTEEISKITGIGSLGKIEERLEELRKEYEGKGIEVVRNPEGWAMEVRSEILPKVAHLTKYSDLSGGHKRTLALIAYREPVRQSEIIRIQGNKAYAYIKLLAKKGLIRSEKEGRTRILMLTKEFERYFGEEKQRIKEILGQEARKLEKKENEEKSDSEISETAQSKGD